jgi:hypothetical protein
MLNREEYMILEAHKDADAPRWTPGSLAAFVSEGHGHVTCEAYADAVEALVHAARAIVDDYRYDTRCGCGKCSDCKLVLAVEAAEEWGDR